MPRMAKKSGSYHHGDLRRVLVDAAVKVIEKEGVSAISLQALARKAGVSSGAPYHHFESREQLLGAIAADGFALLAGAMKLGADEAAGAPEPGETAATAHLRGLGLGYVRFALAHRGHFRVMFRPELKVHASAEQKVVIERAFVMLGDAIARCQAEGSIAGGDPRPLVLLAWSAVHGASALWIDGPLDSEGLVADGDGLGVTIASMVSKLLRGGAGGPRGRDR
jgi:AcrR family transcriptional regulator